MKQINKIKMRVGIFLVCICFSALLLSSCSGGNQKNGIKIIQKDDLAELIIKDGSLVPGDDLEWHMSESEFLNSDYGSGELDSKSKDFEEERVGKMPNGWTSYMPLVNVKLKDYSVTADSTYVFDENSSLIGVTYGIILSENSAEEYKNILNQLCTEADSLNVLSPQTTEFRDFTTEDVLETNFFLQWTDETNSMYFEINSANFRNTLVMHLRVSVVDLRADEN